MVLIDDKLLDKVSDDAKQNVRLRMNHNFHNHLEAKVQKLVNALELGTVLPIHRHQFTAETYILLRGRLKILYYNSNKDLISECILDHLEGKYGIDIPAGQWHTVEVLAPGTAIFEVKEGPYAPLNEDDIMFL